MSRILVTGGAGFIGSHLVDALVGKHQITIIDNLSTGQKKYINKKAKFIKIDIRSNKIIKVFQAGKFDYIYHLAAQKNLQYSKTNPMVDAEINILGSLNIIEASKKIKIKKIIFYSSAAVYNANAKPPNRETDAVNPLTPYGLAKSVVEKYLEISNLPYTIFRLSNVYGPRQDKNGEGGVIAVFCMQMVKKIKPKIYNTGEQTRDFINVKDVVNASIHAMRRCNKNIINISTGKETSINQLFTFIQHFSNYTIKPLRGIYLHEQHRSALSNQKAKKDLNWKPKLDLNKGLKQTFIWFQKNYEKETKN